MEPKKSEYGEALEIKTLNTFNKHIISIITIHGDDDDDDTKIALQLKVP